MNKDLLIILTILGFGIVGVLGVFFPKKLQQHLDSYKDNVFMNNNPLVDLAKRDSYVIAYRIIGVFSFLLFAFLLYAMIRSKNCP